jgi:hypothetical protein
MAMLRGCSAAQPKQGKAGRIMPARPTSTFGKLRLSGTHSVLKAVPVDLHIPLGSVGIVSLKNRTINPAAELFIEYARQLAKQLSAA